MAGRRTLTIVKPDAFANGKAGLIIALLEQSGFTVKAARVMHLTTAQAGEFYGVHRERGFFGELVEFMTSGPCMRMPLIGLSCAADSERIVVCGGEQENGLVSQYYIPSYYLKL